MQLRKLLEDDDAVSPVIGVILMVAITVILAAVIASFVLGLGPSSNPAPTTTIGFEYEATSDTAGELTISHDGGDTVSANEIYVRGDFNDGGTLSSTTWLDYNTGSPSGVVSASMGDDSQVVSGNRLVLEVGSEYDLDVVWQSQEGDSSTTLNSQEGPDA